MAKHQYQRIYTGYTLLCEDPDKVILGLLEEIKKHTTNGHSFDVVIDPKSSDECTVFIDGDGCDKLHCIDVQKVIKTYEWDDEDFKQKVEDTGDEA